MSLDDRMAQVALSLIVVTILLVLAAWPADAHKMTCEDKDERIEQLATNLRLRTAELAVNAGMLRAAQRKLKECGSE